MQKSAVPLALALSLAASQAFAHAQLVRADPRVGSTVTGPPARLWLKFDQIVRLPGTGVQLSYPDGRKTVLALGRDPKDDQAVVAPLPPNLPAGRYLVNWRALSPDAHHTQGDFTFTVSR